MSKTSKHRDAGKHSLKNDIFKGTREELFDGQDTSTVAQDTFNYDPSSLAYDEAFNNEDYLRNKKLKDLIYSILRDNTNVSMDTVRRKPSKADFNKYYSIVKKELLLEKYTNIEIFMELYVYFSDNTFAMFKLLDNKWRDQLIGELREHIGKLPQESKVLNKRNLKIGSEVEFVIVDKFDDYREKIITGVILSYDEDEDEYKVDSFENIYFLKISDITKILNNTKFRYNLNKLDNIDFI